MSPKRKKVESALKNLFSNSSKPGANGDEPIDAPVNATEAPEVETKNEQPAPAAKKPAPEARKSSRTKTHKPAKEKQEEEKKPAATAAKEAAQEVPSARTAVEKPAAVIKESASVKRSQVEKVEEQASGIQETEAEMVEAEAPQKEEPKAKAGEKKHAGIEKQLVVFTLDGELYGVEIALVESIIKMQPFTVVPHTPDYIIGVTNLRGYVLPVVDLRRRFNLPRQAESADTRIMVMLIKNEKVGMVVDEVNEVATVPGSQIEPTPKLVSTVKMEFVSGIAKLQNEETNETRMAILLDMEKVLKLH